MNAQGVHHFLKCATFPKFGAFFNTHCIIKLLVRKQINYKRSKLWRIIFMF